MRIIDTIPLEGPSIFCLRPALKIVLDLGSLAGVSTNQLENFNANLLQMLPALRSHYCSRGYPGGFVERLEEGTYLGHVLEHVVLELMHRGGMKAAYGKTVSTAEPGRVEVIIETDSFRPTAFLARCAVKLLNLLVKGQRPSLDGLWEQLSLIRQQYEPGPSTAAIIEEAKRRGIPVTRLKEGSSLYLLGHGVYQKRIQATLTSATGCLAADLAGDKDLAKMVLDRAGIPTPRGIVVASPSQAVEAARKLGVPVVVKPCDANQGKGVSLNLTQPGMIKEAYKLAARYGSKVMVEEYITGRHYRLLVVGGKFVAAARRLPAQVKGDGSSTILQLIDQLNSDPRRGKGHARPLTKIELNEEVRLVLARQNKDEYYRPAKGEVVLLRENANLSTGGFAWDVTEKIHPDNVALAERAAAIIGLDIAGIDLVAPDLAQSVITGSGAVIEVNAAPGIRMHLYPSRGKGRNVAVPIVSSLFPQGGNGRIPIFSITGTNGKTTTARLLAHILRLARKRVGLTTTEGVYIDGQPVFRGDAAGPKSARMILEDPTVEAAVLEAARGGIIRGGLGYDRSDVAVITNISMDHLGQDGLHTLEDLVFVKSLLVETVQPKGAVVLNADDVNVLKMLPRAAAPVVLFTLEEDNLVLVRHLSKGGKGITVRRNHLYWFCGKRWHCLMPIYRVAIGCGGLALHHLQNAMAAAAAALAFGIPRQLVVSGLATFLPSAEHNPGRGNLYDLKKGKLLLDYGHNQAAFAATLRFASLVGKGRIIGVLGVPGDRSDDLIRHCGQVAAPFLDEIILKEDRDLRGRPPGVTADLLRQGCLKSKPAARIQIIHDEVQAVRRGLEMLEEDDLLVVFYELRKPIESLLQEFLQPEATPLAAALTRGVKRLSPPNRGLPEANWK